MIIFAPSLRWQSDMFQRPQQLALALARQGALVFYMEVGTTKKTAPFRQVEDRLYISRVDATLYHVIPGALVYLLTWNSGYQTVFKRPQIIDDQPQIIYDFVDSLELYKGDPQQILQEHQKLLGCSRLVLATAENLYRQASTSRSDVLLCPNGVDYDHFKKARIASGVIPTEMAPILSAGRPIVGYHGALAEWFDYALFRLIVAMRPDLSFVLIGPDFDNSLTKSGVGELPNVYWLGPKPYSDLPDYMRYFDVGMIPFQLNEITHSTSPIKLYEYMACGKPVVITPMRESLRCEGVLPANGPEEFSRQLDHALTLKSDPAFLRLSEEIARQNTWQARARQILDALERKN